MWAIASLLPVRSMAIVVLPIPRSLGSSSMARRRLEFASRTDFSSAGSACSAPMLSPSSGASCPTISELATSPAAWPPIPSARTRRCGPAYPLSSLRDFGPSPRSVRAA